MLQLLNLGSTPNDNTGTSLRDGGSIINQNFTELYTKILTNNSVAVNTSNDLPTTLAPNTTYVLGADISVSEPRIWADGAAIISGNKLGVQITYTGTGTLFSGTDCDVVIDNIQINAANGTLFSFSNPANNKKLFIEGLQNTVCSVFGVITGYQVKVIDLCEVFCSSGGVTYAGTGSLVNSISRVALISTSNSFVAVNLQSSSSLLLTVDRLVVSAPAGATGISGLSSSANILPTGLGAIQNCTFTGGITTALLGITEDDIRYEFDGNIGGGVRDSLVFGKLYLSSPSAVVVPVTSPTFSVIQGTSVFSAESLSRFVLESNGTYQYLKYIGERPVKVRISGFCSMQRTGGVQSNKLEARVAKNGTASATKGATTEQALFSSVPVDDSYDLVTNDKIHIMVTNLTNNTSIDVDRIQVIVTGI